LSNSPVVSGIKYFLAIERMNKILAKKKKLKSRFSVWLTTLFFGQQ